MMLQIPYNICFEMSKEIEHGVAPAQPLENKALYTDLNPFLSLKTCFLTVISTL